MNDKLLLPLLALLPATLFAADKSPDCDRACGTDTAVGCGLAPAAADAAKPADAAKRYPLRGVILDVQADQSALLVKHEDIPGFMRAMTMRFKVDAATLKAAKKNQAITGLLVRRDGEFWLEEVKLSAQPGS